MEATNLDRVPALVITLLKDEAIGGKLILAAAVLALLIANSPLNPFYQDFWHYGLTLGLNSHAISMSLGHWVSEGLMAIFFLVVGLEIKREIVHGQLRHVKTALLPIGAAIGGMVVPSALFFAINYGQPEVRNGWAIPVATDIAFALAVMSLLGRRISSSLKLFLLTLAIVDDIGAIVLIAIFYNTGLAPAFLLVALAIVAIIVVLNRLRLMSISIFVVLGVGLWIAVYKSGIHASIAGALLGLLAPLAIRGRTSVAEKLEKMSIPVSTFVIVPLFAFSSLGIPIVAKNITQESATLIIGILVGLVIGKVVGVTAASWLLVKYKVAVLPSGTNWFQLAGVGFLTGIGFTVSVFIAELAFGDNQALTNTAKLSVLAASTISALIGYVFLRHREKVQSFVQKQNQHR